MIHVYSARYNLVLARVPDAGCFLVCAVMNLFEAALTSHFPCITAVQSVVGSRDHAAGLP